MARACLIILLALVASAVTKNSCPDQFIKLGSFCYLFSDVEEDWEGARGVCEGIGIVHQETIVLAVLDYGLSTDDNQLLLTNATERGGSYWLGGSLDEDIGIWKWVSHNNSEIDLRANYWYSNHPTSDGDCLMLKKESNWYRSYAKATDCSQRSKVICQVIPKDIGFRSIGNDQFYFSMENDIDMKMSWEAARNFCLFLEPPNHFNNVDLAVLGFNHELDQEFLQAIADIGNKTWLGGHQIAGSRNFTWVDERDVDETSYFFDSEHSPSATNSYYSHDWATFADVTTVNGHTRSALGLCCLGCDSYDVEDKYECTSYLELPFVCQAFKI